MFYTVEPQYKVKDVFVNLKNFYILDVQELIKTSHLDLSKGYNIYFINKTILDTIEEQYNKKSNKGLIFINKNLSVDSVDNITNELTKRNVWVRNILIDNGQCPKLKHIYYNFEEVLFFDKYKKIKIDESLFNGNMFW